MGYPREANWMARAAVSVALRYGLALVSVAAAFGLASSFLYFHLPQPFTAFALSAIAITFWYGGIRPGILAALLTSIVRSYLFEPEVDTVSNLLYNIVFLIFALLMTRVTGARNELEARVAERTAELTRANAELKLELAERKRAEGALRESEQRFRDYAETASDWLWETGPDHRFIRVSEQLATTGIRPALRVGVRLRDFATDLDEEPEKWRLHIATLEAHRPFRDFRYRTTGGDDSVLYFATSGKPVFDPEGRFLGYRGVSSDVTAAVRAEKTEEALHKVRAELAHATRMTTLGELTASVAHEVNQPIAAAITNANTCLRWLAGDIPNLEEARAATLRIVNDGTRAAEIIKRIRLLFQKGSSDRELLDIREVIREMIVLLRSEATRYSISVRTELAADLPQVMGDRVQLQQVMMNLIVNSIDAMKDMEGARELGIKSQQAESEEVMVSVSDTGVGLPPQQANQIFNAFFTTKPHGTGMGLSITRSIVESHGGRLWAADNSPRGASFHFTLPTQVGAHE